MRDDQAFPIAGVGASAGGVEALEQLFRALPRECGIAFVVVTHLGPGHESALPEILGKAGPMPVLAAADGQVVQPDHAYVLPHEAVLTIEAGVLRLRPPEPAGRRERQPVDVFLASLAENSGESAIGILLSGGGSDGTLGMKAIKLHGGLTVAQGSDGTAPRYPNMPASAIAAGIVDLVLPVGEIPAALDKFAQALAAPSSPEPAEDGADGAAPDGPTSADPAAMAAARTAICNILRGQIGHDFSGYKDKTFFRRVRRRMQVLRLTTLEEYVERLRQDPDQVTLLFRDLLISVTGFFRDPGAFAALAEQVIPSLFEGRGAADTLRVWVPGCATGEEAYSLAMLLREHMDGLRNLPRVQVFATDIDEAALQVARAGRYPAALTTDIPAARLARFFTREGPAYTVTKELRDLCVFSAHSLVRDPPFSRIDLISCRNLLIYLDNGLQDTVVPVFHYALRPGGFLFLGASENTTRSDALFAAQDKANRIFRRRESVAAAPPRLPFQAAGEWPPRPGPAVARPPAPAGAALRQAVEAMLLEQFAPAYVVVDREGEVVHQSARLGKYCEPVPGVPSRQLLAMARRGLRLELRAALQEALETRRRAVRPRVEIEVDDRIQPIQLTVAPLPTEPAPPGHAPAEPLYLVVFTDLGPPHAADEPPPRPAGSEDDSAALERELREMRQRLQATVEEYETAVEELRSANEEMVSVNEELQSANEELQTVNLELGAKVDELDRANADLRNLFESTRIATIFLDRHLVIRNFTPAAVGIFNLIPGDRGRPLTDLATELDQSDLRSTLQVVLDSRQPREVRVSARQGSTHYTAPPCG